MKRVLVTGAGGMTGTEVSERAALAGWNVVAMSHADFDITDRAAVDVAFREAHPDVVINCAAYTAVDRAESEPDAAAAVNTDGARNVARAVAAIQAPIIHISTDYVFGGDGREPYLPDAPTGPAGIYGKTKLDGEIAIREETPYHAIVRTSWVFSHRGSNFVKTMLRLSAERDELRVVNDQVGRPTSSADLAEALLATAEGLLENEARSGTYHFANAGETSWFGFAQAIFEEGGAKHGARSPRLVPISTAEFLTPARRPAYSVLDTSSFIATFGVVPRPWRDALRDTLARI
jgi:dTDP-4-dehydrorhamnose reductase